MTTNTQTAQSQNTLTQSSQDLLAKKRKKEEKIEKRKKAWNYYNDKSKTGFVGLSNQGATCYMNSLLQTLFMTPEFRMALYRWEYEEEKEGPKKESIPYQLQKLFAKLQLSEMSSIETKGLTKSFGWGIKDALEQHDIQELNRVLFDALEKSFRDTPSYDLVNELYQGTMVDQIVCQKCNNKIQREDKFLDIPLVIRGISSVEAALDKFVEDEVLDGDNKYFCEKCSEKCDAWKGLKLKDLPYLLTLQLKRFDIDYETFDRVKLHNPVSFPRYLDMDRYVNSGITVSSNSTPLPDENNNLENQEEEDDEDDEKKADEKFLSYMMTNMRSKKDVEEDLSNLEPVDESQPPQGDNVYELYSILIHSGTAGVGHYFAYIKSFDDKRWYNFNDEHVSFLKKNEIENSFGGKKNSGWGGSTNAYMLVYRKVKPDVNISKILNEQVTEYHREKIYQFNGEFIEESKEHKRLKDKLSLKVVWDKSNYPFAIDKNETLESAKQKIIEMLEFDKLPEAEKIAPENIRIREYDSMRGIPTTIYDDPQATLASLNIKNHYHLCVETRKVGEEWPKYNLDDLVVRVCFFNNATNEPDNPLEITLTRDSTLLNLKEQIISLFNLDNHDLRCFTVGLRIDELKYESFILSKDYNVVTGERIYVENNSGTFLENGEEFSPSVEWIKQTKDTIKLKYNKLGTTTYDETVTVQQFLSLADLKAKLAEIIGLPVDKFKMKRKAAIMFELKDLTCNLAEAALSNSSVIHLEEGIPLERDQYSFKIIYYDEDAPESKFNFKFELAVFSSATWLDVKKIIGERLNLKVDHIRLREKFGTHLSKIFKSQNTIKKSIPYLNDGKEIVVQNLAEPEDLQDDDVVLCLTRYYPRENKVAGKEELVIKKDVTLFEFRELVSNKTGIPNERMQFAKPFSIQTLLHLDSLKDLSWKKYVPKEQATQKLTAMMWFIVDGDLFVYKDQDEDPEESRNSNTTAMNLGPGESAAPKDAISLNRPRREEKALKIKTRFDKEEEKKLEAEREKREKEEKEKKEQEENNNNNNNNSEETSDSA